MGYEAELERERRTHRLYKYKRRLEQAAAEAGGTSLTESECRELALLLRDAQRWIASESTLRETRDALARARKAYATACREKRGAKAAQAAACRSLGLTRSDGRSGPRYDAFMVIHDYANMRSGSWLWAGKPHEPEAAVIELVRLHGFASVDACKRYLQRERQKLRKAVASETGPPLPTLEREMLEWLDDLPQRSS